MALPGFLPSVSIDHCHSRATEGLFHRDFPLGPETVRVRPRPDRFGFATGIPVGPLFNGKAPGGAVRWRKAEIVITVRQRYDVVAILAGKEVITAVVVGDFIVTRDKRSQGSIFETDGFPGRDRGTKSIDEHHAPVHRPVGFTHLALRRPPERKHQQEGGPTVRECIALLREWSATPVLDILAFIDALIFNMLIGNADAHGKNYSMIYAAGTRRLAPLYDLAADIRGILKRCQRIQTQSPGNG